MTHYEWIRRRLGRSLRVRLSALLLALIILPAIFAELIAGEAPVLAIGPRGVSALPAVVERAEYEALTAAEIARRHADDWTIWPLLRHGPAKATEAGPDQPPSWRHPLGTGPAGRDLLARLIYGARGALGLTFVTLALSLLLGGAMGAIAGYLGGIWDELLARPVELVETFPAVVVVVVVRAIDPAAALWSLALAIAAVRWAEIARLVRAEVVRISQEDFVLAARALGCSRTAILRRHILPHATRPVVVSLLFGVASVVLLEVAVSFLGLGLEGSWGALIAEGLAPEAPLRGSICGAAALGVTVGSAYLLADALGEKLDARVATVDAGSAVPLERD